MTEEEYMRHHLAKLYKFQNVAKARRKADSDYYAIVNRAEEYATDRTN